jgi:YHS domain-containing protein
MVRDRVCNTFVPDGRALIERVDGEAHYFCSERCRSSFLRESAGNPPGC